VDTKWFQHFLYLRCYGKILKTYLQNEKKKWKIKPKTSVRTLVTGPTYFLENRLSLSFQDILEIAFRSAVSPVRQVKGCRGLNALLLSTIKPKIISSA
jgi:hypothetical protein